MSNEQNKERRCILADVKLESRSDGEESRTISGHAITFDTWSKPLGYGSYKFIERIDRRALDECDMSDVIDTFNHNIDDILARTSSGTLKLSVDEVGLKFSFDAPHTSRGNDLVELVKRGDINKCSFIMEVTGESWVYADAENGKPYHERTVTKISRLFDISQVVHPAYQDTEVSVRSRESIEAEIERRNQRLKEELEIRDREFQFVKIQNNNH